MIHWMSDEVNDLLDNFKDGDGTHIPIVFTVCDGTPEGHIELRMEVMDDVEAHIYLGDCTGLSDAEVNACFVKAFAEMANNYWYDYNVADIITEAYLIALAAAMEKTI